MVVWLTNSLSSSVCIPLSVNHLDLYLTVFHKSRQEIKVSNRPERKRGYLRGKSGG